MLTPNNDSAPACDRSAMLISRSEKEQGAEKKQSGEINRVSDLLRRAV